MKPPKTNLMTPPETPKDDPPKPVPTNVSKAISEEFGEIEVDMSLFSSAHMQKVWTSIPRSLHTSIIQNGKPTEFLKDSMVYLNKLQDVIAAARRLELLRQSEGKPLTVSGYVPDEDADKLTRAETFLSKNLYKSSKAFVVGGCVMLLAEDRQLVQKS